MERSEDHSETGDPEPSGKGGGGANCSIPHHQGIERTTTGQEEGQTWYLADVFIMEDIKK